MLNKNQQTLIFSTLSSLLLMVIKITVGYFFNLLVLVVDGIESLFDIITGSISFIALWISRKEPDEKFPFGYYKVEDIVSFILSSLIILSGISLFFDALDELNNPPTTISSPVLVLLLTISTVIIVLITYLVIWKIAKTTNSPIVEVTKDDKFKDLITNIIVFCSIVLTLVGFPLVMTILSLLLCLAIFLVGLKNLKNSLFSLLDVSPDKELESKVRDICMSITGVRSINNLKLRKAGSFVFGQVDIQINKTIDILRGHEIAEKVKLSLMEKISDLQGFAVHIEPYSENIEKVLIPVQEQNGLKSKVQKHFARAKLLVLLTLDRKNKIVVSEPKFINNPLFERPKLAGLEVAKFVSGLKVDHILLENIGEVAFHTLRDNLIDIYKLDTKANYTVEKAIADFLDNKLGLMDKPTHESVK